MFTSGNVELVSVELSLDLNGFLLAFFRFTNLRGAVDRLYSDKSTTFCAAADWIPNLLGSTEFQNPLRKSNVTRSIYLSTLPAKAEVRK